MLKYPLYNNLDRHITFLAEHKGKIYKELYLLGYDPEDYIRLFQTGPRADSWDTGADYLIKFPADRSALMFVLDLRDYYGIDVKLLSPETYAGGWLLPDKPDGFSPSALEWMGRTYEMWARYMGLSSKEVYEKIPFRNMYPNYIASRYENDYDFMRRIATDPEEYKVVPPQQFYSNEH